MTNAEYLVWLNRELRADENYVEGMAFIHVPQETPIERASRTTGSESTAKTGPTSVSPRAYYANSRLQTVVEGNAP